MIDPTKNDEHNMVQVDSRGVLIVTYEDLKDTRRNYTLRMPKKDHQRLIKLAKSTKYMMDETQGFTLDEQQMYDSLVEMIRILEGESERNP